MMYRTPNSTRIFLGSDSAGEQHFEWFEPDDSALVDKAVSMEKNVI